MWRDEYGNEYLDESNVMYWLLVPLGYPPADEGDPDEERAAEAEKEKTK